MEIGFVVLALKLRLLISHAFHYFYLNKHLVKKIVAKAVDISMLNVTSSVANVPGVLRIDNHFSYRQQLCYAVKLV